jgi:hypothetical protein
MLKTVEGIYQNGQIELTEVPQDVSEIAPQGFSLPFLDPGKIASTKLRQLIEQLERLQAFSKALKN